MSTLLAEDIIEALKRHDYCGHEEEFPTWCRVFDALVAAEEISKDDLFARFHDDPAFPDIPGDALESE